MSGSPRPRGRYAPTPSGLIHLGNARTALLAWWSIRRSGGTFLWRLEDLDPPRSLPGAAEAALEDLAWLGIDWDEGPDRGGPHGPYEQSRRSPHYEKALRQLETNGRLFPCRRSRKDLRQLASAPHADDSKPPPYPAAWRPQTLPPEWLEDFLTGRGEDAAIRFAVAPGPIEFDDLLLGSCTQRVDLEVGDFVLRRRDGLWAYQLAVVVDDLAMGIDEVVRGVDILDSTGRQIQLIQALGGAVPTYAHVPLIRNAEGEKLSKRDQGLTLASLREHGISPEAVVGYLAHTLGLTDSARPRTAAELTEAFAWERLHRDDWILPQEPIRRLFS